MKMNENKVIFFDTTLHALSQRIRLRFSKIKSQLLRKTSCSFYFSAKAPKNVKCSISGSCANSEMSPSAAGFVGEDSKSNVKRNSKSIPGIGRDSSFVKLTSIAANFEMMPLSDPGRCGKLIIRLNLSASA